MLRQEDQHALIDCDCIGMLARLFLLGGYWRSSLQLFDVQETAHWLPVGACLDLSASDQLQDSGVVLASVSWKSLEAQSLKSPISCAHNYRNVLKGHLDEELSSAWYQMNPLLI